ncbi:GroES-like protein [Xylariomycetidae sp. FL0641]|nr:GroES-like protein [Xylariomycetidae sp. FL0641]
MSIQQYQATAQGGPFALVSVPAPQPGAGEISIRPRAVALNGIDWKNVAFGALIRAWPAVLGIDGAGTVEAVGEGVADFAPGDPVLSFAHGIHGRGAFAELYTVPAALAAKKPAGLSFEEAASLPTIFYTAAAAVLNGLQIGIPGLSSPETTTTTTTSPPKSILVLGGSSGVGASAIQLLRLALPEATIVATASPAHHAHLRALGASACLAREAQGDTAALKSATTNDDDGYDAILDAVGAGGAAAHAALRSRGGRYALVVTAPGAALPAGVDGALVGAEMMLAVPGAMAWLGRAVEEGRFALPLRVEVVGEGWLAVEKGLQRFPAQVSGVKLVVKV